MQNRTTGGEELNSPDKLYVMKGIHTTFAEITRPLRRAARSLHPCRQGNMENRATAEVTA
jgi:hypothetical protein